GRAPPFFEIRPNLRGGLSPLVPQNLRLNQRPIPLVEFGHLDRLIACEVAEHLRRAAGRPMNLDPLDPIGVPQPDRPLEGACAEAAAGGNVPVNYERRLSSRDDLDPRADRRAVGLLPDQLERDPATVVAGVLKQNIVVLVAVDGPSHLDENIDVSV